MTTELNHPLLKRNVWCILGLPFDNVTLSGAEHIVRTAVNTREHCFVSTPNLNFAITAQSDETFFNSVVESDLSLADGMPIVWLARLLGIPITERVAGSDLFNQLSEHAGTAKVKVFFFGGQTGIARIAHEKLNLHSQGLVSCGYYDPGFVSVEEMSRPEIINEINRADADFIVVALGAKKGQQWIQRNKNQLKAPVCSHLGAVINFVAEHVERAPRIWQKTGLEWLWRIRQEPALWRRYFGDGTQLIARMTTQVLPLALYSYRLRHTGQATIAGSVISDHENDGLIRLQGSIHYSNLQDLRHTFVRCLQGGGDIVIDMADSSYIDAAFIATLLLFQNYLKQQARKLTLQHVPRQIYRLLKYSGMLTKFNIHT